MIVTKIDVSKIDKNFLFKGNKGTYMDLLLMENREGPDQFGNDGFVAQGVSKEAKERGEKGPIIGNWKRVGLGNKPQQKPQPKPSVFKSDDNDVPF